MPLSRAHVSALQPETCLDMDLIITQLARYGVPLIGLNVFLQQIGLPIPAVPTMMVAGALAMGGRVPIVEAFAISVAASLVADILWFWAGRRYGYSVLRLLCRVSLSPDTCVRQTEDIFERWGYFSVVISKFVPGFATVAPPIAGALRMPIPAFVIASLASAMRWVGAAIGTGALFARQIDVALLWMSTHFSAAAWALAALVALYVASRALQRYRLSRMVAASIISVDELRERLAGGEPLIIIDVGSRIAQATRPHIPGALLRDLDAIARLHPL